jgi:thiol-disulfide isomerase/thioredoxin
VPRPLRLVASIVLGCALLAGCTGKNAVSNGSEGPQLKGLPQPGANHLIPVADRVPAPPIRGETVDGGQLDLSQYRGKVVVLNFWASWCAPCRAESPYLVKVAAETAPLGVSVVGVNFKDERSAARRFDEVHDVRYPSLFDQPGVILTRLRRLVPQEPPTTLLIDRAGRIAMLLKGGVTDTELTPPVRVLASEQG